MEWVFPNLKPHQCMDRSQAVQRPIYYECPLRKFGATVFHSRILSVGWGEDHYPNKLGGATEESVHRDSAGRVIGTIWRYPPQDTAQPWVLSVMSEGNPFSLTIRARTVRDREWILDNMVSMRPAAEIRGVP